MKSRTAIKIAAVFSLIGQNFAFAETRTIGGNETNYRRTANVEAEKLFTQSTVELYKHGNVQAAIGLLTKALALDPRFVEALDNLGTCYRRTGEYDKAVECYKRSIDLFPNGFFAHQNMAVAYGMLKKYGSRHFLQLASIRALQSRGLPLKKIQELLYGRDDESLEELLERAASESVPAPPEFPAFSTETWHVSALGGPFALLSRDGARPTPAQLAAISEILTNNAVTK